MIAKVPHKPPENLTRWQKIGRETAGLGVAEFASGITSLGVVAVLDGVAPNAVRHTTKVIAKHVIEPYLDVIEGTMGGVCRLEECQPDKTKSREQRAENLARAVTLFVPAAIVSWGVKIFARRWANKKWEIPDETAQWQEPQKWYELHKNISKKEWLVVGVDEGVHLGSILMVNTGVPKKSSMMMRGVEGVLLKCGFSQQKARDIASMAVIWELPNALGFVAGIGGIFAHHTYGWAHKDRPPGSKLFDHLPEHNTPHR